jgi:hypothetical protein
MTGAIWLSDTPPFPILIGSSQTGFAIGYGACLASPIHVMLINYFAQGTSQTCCEYPVLPDPNVPSGQIEVVDCTQNLIFGSGATAVVNSDMTCPCGGLLKVEESTWGRIKAMYAPESPVR